MPSPARTLLVAFVSAWFLLGGLGHFVFTDFFVGIVPPYVPWPLAAVWVSGVFELLGAAALLVPAWRRLAACGLFILTLCVTPANLYMWQHPDLFPSFPPTLLAARLALQAFLLGCILAADAGAGRGAAGTTLGAGEKKPLCGGGQWPGMPGDGGAIGPGVDRVVAALSRVCMAIGELCEEVQSRAANGRTVLHAAGRSR